MTIEKKLREGWRLDWKDIDLNDEELAVADWWLFKISQILQEKAQEIERLKKRVDKNKTTDQKRYPIGFNQGLNEALKILKK